MPQTPNYGIPYQALTEAPDGPNLGEDGFTRVDTVMAGIDGRLAVAEGKIITIQAGVYRDAVTVATPVAAVTFSGIPTTLRRLQLSITARVDAAVLLADLRLRVGADVGAVYRFYAHFAQNGGVPSTSSGFANTSALIGYVPGAFTAAGVYSGTMADIVGWTEPHADHLSIISASGYLDTAANDIIANIRGAYVGGNPYTSLTVLPSSGNFVAGSDFLLLGWM